MISCKLSINQIYEILTPMNEVLNKDITIEYISTKDDLCDSCLTFIKEVSTESLDNIRNFQNVIIVTEHAIKDYDYQIVVNNTRFAMAKILDYIKPKSIYNNNTLSYISKNSTISETSTIEPFVFIDEGVKIGMNCLIKSGARIFANTIIGDNVIIRENSVIGGQGFGVEKDENDNNFKIHHFGGVIIKDHVEIGALNTIVSGTINPTIISEYTKIDDHVHIAHNCKIGKNCIITAGTILSGSVEIGDNCWVGPNSSIKNALKIASNTLIGIGSVVTKEIETSNNTFAGNPAKEFRKYIDEKKKIEYFINTFDKYIKLISEEDL